MVLGYLGTFIDNLSLNFNEQSKISKFPSTLQSESSPRTFNASPVVSFHPLQLSQLAVKSSPDCRRSKTSKRGSFKTEFYQESGSRSSVSWIKATFKASEKKFLEIKTKLNCFVFVHFYFLPYHLQLIKKNIQKINKVFYILTTAK